MILNLIIILIDMEFISKSKLNRNILKGLIVHYKINFQESLKISDRLFYPIEWYELRYGKIHNKQGYLTE